MYSSQSRWVRGYRSLFSVLILLAIAAQFSRGIAIHGSAINYLSFFTIQSNLIAAGVFLWGAIKPAKEQGSLSRNLIRGAPVLYLAITGIVFGLLLSGLQEQFHITIPWVNMVLHKIMPLVIAMDWLLDPPCQALSFRKALTWLVYPLAWLAYTMLRGAWIEWYPYPFLDPALLGGYGVVLSYVLGILLGALPLIWLIVLIGQRICLSIKPKSI